MKRKSAHNIAGNSGVNGVEELAELADHRAGGDI
jgi:hypothetical protein